MKGAILVVRKGTCSATDLKSARDAGIIVLQAKDPNDVRFIEPPAVRSRIERLALDLVREVNKTGGSLGRDDVRRQIAALVLADERPEPPKSVKP